MLSKDAAQAARSLIHQVEEAWSEGVTCLWEDPRGNCPDVFECLDDWCRMCRVRRAAEELKWHLTNEGAYE